MVVPAPGAVTTLEGKNCAVTPVGRPVAVSVTMELKLEFGMVVSVSVRDVPAATLIEVTEDASVNVGTGATVTESAAICLVAPLSAATVAG